MKPIVSTMLTIGIAVPVAVLLAVAGGDGALEFGGVALTVWGVLLAFAINWLVWIHAYANKTERFFDLTGSITYIGVALFVLLAGDRGGRAILVAAMVCLWALRLGTFLFTRIRSDGHDRRFDKLKVNLWLSLRTWTLQGIWVSFTVLCALTAISASAPEDLGLLDAVGVLIWLGGFSIEAIADQQKRTFRADEANAGQFITTGLWSWSRHPNYFGEITLWTGVAIVALSDLSGWQYLTLISPVFVYLLLTRISGVQLLERRAERTWGDEPEFRAYVERTNALVPMPPR